MPEKGWAGVRHVLQDLDFPAPKEQIVQHAQAHGTDASVIKLLRALPLATYYNLAEVRRSVRLDPDEVEPRTPEIKARQAREHHRRVAEYLRDPGPIDPEL